jgi:hypothetical protein
VDCFEKKDTLDYSARLFHTNERHIRVFSEKGRTEPEGGMEGKEYSWETRASLFIRQMSFYCRELYDYENTREADGIGRRGSFHAVRRLAY